jgi:hypothetical protein
MNLRIENNQLRFRITQDETALLTRHGEVSSRLDLGTSSMTYEVALATLEQPLALNVQEHVWTLRVNREDFRAFLSSLPARDGLEHTIIVNGVQIALVLEVDVRRVRAS